jgi:two-component system sensor histidine kinase KdpD
MVRRARDRPLPVIGLLVGVVLVVVITAALVPFRTHATRATPALALVLPVVVTAIVGGRAAAILSAVVAAMAFSLAFIPPLWTPKINSVDDAVAFLVFIVVAVVVGTLVAQEAARRRAAEQRIAEIQALHERYEAVVAERERLTEESHRLELMEGVDRQRTALLRSVSHDLRTPLATIRGATSDIRAGAAYDEATRNELLDLVCDETERLDRLVANLLSLTRIESGALSPDRQPVSVEELLRDRARQLGRLFRHARLEIDVPPGLPLVDADYSQLDQVLTNLLENAARHSPEGSVVTVRAVQDGNTVGISVSDEGPGVDASQREQLFEPFRRGQGSESTGVGLAICKAVVEAHGGRIRLLEGDHAGAVFVFTLPIHHGRA